MTIPILYVVVNDEQELTFYKQPGTPENLERTCMELQAFQVKNYRPIIYNGLIKVRTRTALVGRNESVKTGGESHINDIR